MRSTGKTDTGLFKLNLPNLKHDKENSNTNIKR